MMQKRRLIGITGTLSAGKGTVADYLVGKGFVHHSAREFITREIVKRGLPVNRDSMVNVANDLRSTYGPSYVVESMAKEALAAGQDAVLESVRTPGEVEALKQLGGTMLAIDADRRTRFERILKRGIPETDRLTFEEFVAQEDREMTATDPNKQNLRRCIELADIRIENNGTVEDLYAKVEQTLQSFSG
jgi:dephospho-CoA kinase